jgi:hypothetical protein
LQQHSRRLQKERERSRQILIQSFFATTIMETNNPAAPSVTSPTVHDNPFEPESHASDHQSPFDSSTTEEAQPAAGYDTKSENVQDPSSTTEAPRIAEAATEHNESLETESENAEVATLKSMFPDFDSGALYVSNPLWILVILINMNASYFFHL